MSSKPFRPSEKTMGGGGEYYHRDVHDGYARSARGVSAEAEQLMNRSNIDPGILPKNRHVTSRAKSPIVYIFDVTGSMGNLPKIIADKMPMVAGQIRQNGYLPDVEISLACVGDVKYDKAPIQIGDFTEMKLLDDWLKRLWVEGGGGADDEESYEFLAYFYARFCDFAPGANPICLFTADEGMASRLYKGDLERRFGGTHETVSTVDIFNELDKKFNGNVFLIHRHYPHNDEKALRVWRKCLGNERIIRLGSDQSIADVTLGLFALVSGASTLDAFLEDMVTKRARAQTNERIAEVRKALTPLAAYVKIRQVTHQSVQMVEQNGNSFPSPDDLNRQLGAEIMAEIERYLLDLGTMLKGPDRPTPQTDGWTYCPDPVLPIAIATGKSEWEYVRSVLATSNWEAERVGFTQPSLRIRRLA